MHDKHSAGEAIIHMAEVLVEVWKLTSPGQTINLKLLNKFAISMRDIGLTPLTCSI